MLKNNWVVGSADVLFPTPLLIMVIISPNCHQFNFRSGAMCEEFPTVSSGRRTGQMPNDGTIGTPHITTPHGSV